MNFAKSLVAPIYNEDMPRPWLFLAGGITGCPDWQKQALNTLLGPVGGTLLSPRREHFDITDPNAAEAQITWEYKMLEASDAIIFWFPKEEIQPIALFELGRWSSVFHTKNVFVGVHPEYKRRQDVEIQMRLERPELIIHYNLDDLCKEVLTHF